MEDTRSHKKVAGELEGEARRTYVRHLLGELRALERMVETNAFERGVSRIGAEQEIFLVDKAYHPASGALRLLEALKDPHYTTELGLFNLEMNADPQPFSGNGLSAMEEQLRDLLGRVRTAGAPFGCQPVLAGILPTIGKTDLGLDSMVPNPRYQMLNRAMNHARGAAFDFSIRGLDELVVKHDSVMVEACNASFQVHLQLAEPERFAHHYNVAQLLLAPVLACSTNSPLLFGRRLWSETRIALFEQACDIRTPGLHLRESAGRVSFGRSWLKGSIADVFKENLTHFRALVGTEIAEDPMDALDEGRAPELKALRLHNGTIYRWNRACYGISENGKPHLRIELRILPSGPSIVDEVASAALWLGLMHELGATLEDVPSRIRFEDARANFYNAARDGLTARVRWLDGEELPVRDLLLQRLIPLAARGLARAGIDTAEAARYLAVVEARVASEKTGSRWTLDSLAAMGERGTNGSRSSALVAATISRQASEKPVVDWSPATIEENDSAKSDFQKVAQYMRTTVFTVLPDDPIEFVAEVMNWERIRYVPVEDERGRLVGLVSNRSLLRHFSERLSQRDLSAPHATAVSEIMKTALVTVTPDTSTKEAIAFMQRHRVGCLPVVQDGHIVAIVTEEDFVGLVGKVLENDSK